MRVLIIKLGASGDVVRTTPLLRQLHGEVTWLTTTKNGVLLDDVTDNLNCIAWEQRAMILDCSYDLAINLEDTLDVAQFLSALKCGEIFVAHVGLNRLITYPPSSKHKFIFS